MKYASKILLGVLGLSTASQVAISTPVLADTFTGSGTGGSWTIGDGATDVSTTVTSSYTVTIPATLALPQTDTYTSESNNVQVVANAHIASDQSISVKLANNQAFQATNSGDTVAYKLKLADGTKLTGTTDAQEILKVDAQTAHDTGSATSINVGFDTAPDYKYSGTYTGYVQFEVGVAEASPVVVNDDGTVTFADVKWQILVDGETDDSPSTHKGDYLIIRENVLTKHEAGMQEDDYPYASTDFGDYTNPYYFNSNEPSGNAYERSLVKTVVDYYAATILSDTKLAKGVLPVKLNNLGYNDFKNGSFTSATFNGFNDWHIDDSSFAADGRGATTVDATGTKQGFILSYGDIQTLPDVGPGVYQSNLLSSKQGFDTWLRSPGSDNSGTGEIGKDGRFDINTSLQDSYMPVRPAFWVTTN